MASRPLTAAIMKCGHLTVILLGILTFPVAAQNRPKVSLIIPPGIASETVQIEYFREGKFGGSGGFVKALRDTSSYEIEPFVNGQPADGVKVIAYMPGCEVATLDVAFSGEDIERRLDCDPMGSVLFSGEVVAVSAIRQQSAEVEVSYLASWSHSFYGMSDGPVTVLRLGTVRPDTGGKFQITLPDLYQQPLLRDGYLQFILRDVKIGNIIAFLKPSEAKPNFLNEFSLRATYPLVHFAVQKEMRAKTR